MFAYVGRTLQEDARAACMLMGQKERKRARERDRASEKGGGWVGENCGEPPRATLSCAQFLQRRLFARFIACLRGRIDSAAGGGGGGSPRVFAAEFRRLNLAG